MDDNGQTPLGTPAPAANTQPQGQAGQNPLPTNEPQEGQAVPTPTKETPSLEEEVARELGHTQGTSDTLAAKAARLAETRTALEEKIKSLESDVKQKLAALKDLKGTIEEEIAKIKEYKDSEAKIDAELGKIKELEERRAEIEHEIQAIEQSQGSA